MTHKNRLDLLSEKKARLVSDSLARTRLLKLLDPDTFTEIDAFASMNENRSGVITGYGLIKGRGVYVFSQDVSINAGAIDDIHARKVKKMYEMASKTGMPLIGIYDSNGAKLDDVPSALNAYGEMLFASNNLSGVVPQISLVLGTCAGTSAMVACGADFIIMSEEAEFFLNAPRVAENRGQAVGEAGTVRNAAKSGVAHITAPTEDEAITKARTLIAYFPQNNLSPLPEIDYEEPNVSDILLHTICNTIEQKRLKDYIHLIVDHGNTLYLSAGYGDDTTVALSTLYGTTVLVVGIDGSLGPNECNKIAYYVNLCDSFSIPVISFINTDGFSTSVADEVAGSVRQASKLAHIFAQSSTQKIAVITGRAYGSAYIALAGKASGADLVLAWPSAIISPLYPSTAVAFLASDLITIDVSREQAEEDYKITLASPFRFAEKGYVDNVIDPSETRACIADCLDMLSGKRVHSIPRKHINIPF